MSANSHQDICNCGHTRAAHFFDRPCTQCSCKHYAEGIAYVRRYEFSDGVTREYVLASDYDALSAQNAELVKLLQHFTVRPSFHHDCDDYTRGYGEALAVVATQAANLLAKVKP